MFHVYVEDHESSSFACHPIWWNTEPFSPIIWCNIQTWILFTSKLKCTDNMQTLDLRWIMYAESKCGNSMIATKRCKLKTKRRRSTNYGERFIKCTLFRFMTIDQHGVLWFYETKKWLIAAGSFDEKLARYKPSHILDKTTDKLMKREQKEIIKKVLYGARVKIKTSKLEWILFEIWRNLIKMK